MATRTRTSRTNNTDNTEKETPMTEAATVETPTETAPTEAKPEPKSPMTPYQATKRVNQALKEAGVDREVRSPMLYIYAGKGAFEIHPAEKVTKAGKKHTVHEIDEESFVKWMNEYVRGAVQRASGETKAEDKVDAQGGQVETETAKSAEAE